MKPRTNEQVISDIEFLTEYFNDKVKNKTNSVPNAIYIATFEEPAFEAFKAIAMDLLAVKEENKQLQESYKDLKNDHANLTHAYGLQINRSKRF